VATTLYAVHTSHPSHAARLMLEHKRLDHRVVWLIPGMHAAAVRALGFRGGTVPALRLDGRRIQGTRAIARALDAARPEAPLFPADPARRAAVEEAERWGDEVLQDVPRQIGNWVFSHNPRMRTRLAREAGLPLPSLVGPASRPLTWWFARKHGAGDTERVRAVVATVPAVLDHVDALLAAGTIGGEARNAADFQIGTSVRLLLAIADLLPLFDARPAAGFATGLMADYPTGIPAGCVPGEWLSRPVRRVGSA
jgi:glutathione S-transferase